MREAINRRSIVYNQQLEQVERMEAAGEIVVIRPQKPVVVDRIERDIKKLTELYEEGYRCAEHFAFRFWFWESILWELVQLASAPILFSFFSINLLLKLKFI